MPTAPERWGKASSALVQTGKTRDFPIVLMGASYWSPLMDFLRTQTLATGAISEHDLERLVVTDSPERAIDTILDCVHRHVVAAYAAAARQPGRPA